MGGKRGDDLAITHNFVLFPSVNKNANLLTSSHVPVCDRARCRRKAIELKCPEWFWNPTLGSTMKLGRIVSVMRVLGNDFVSFWSAYGRVLDKASPWPFRIEVIQRLHTDFCQIRGLASRTS